jgi:transposase InsO family protein
MITQARQQQPTLPLSQLCAMFGVNRAWYYQAQHRAEQDPDVALRDQIEQIVLDFPGYGYRRVTKHLQRAGTIVNHKHVLGLMREESLLCQLKRRWIATTNSAHSNRIYPNLIRDLVVDHLNQLWIADITYICLPKQFVYLATILDACSRKCIGWHLSRTIDTDLALAALEMALRHRQVRPGLIHHSDRGVQYTSSAYLARLEAAGIQISMAGKGNPYENAQAERFFRTLKHEEVYLKAYHTFQEAYANIAAFIDEVYNTKRLHSSVGDVPPAEFEAAFTHANEKHT